MAETNVKKKRAPKDVTQYDLRKLRRLAEEQLTALAAIDRQLASLSYVLADLGSRIKTLQARR